MDASVTDPATASARFAPSASSPPTVTPLVTAVWRVRFDAVSEVLPVIASTLPVPIVALTRALPPAYESLPLAPTSSDPPVALAYE